MRPVLMIQHQAGLAPDRLRARIDFFFFSKPPLFLADPDPERPPQQYITTMLRVRAIATSTEPNDAFFHCDLILFYQLLPRSTDERWISAMPYTPDLVQRSLTIHGHPQGQRLLLNSQHLDWVEHVTVVGLKKIFLASLQQVAARSSKGDRILVLINGHGIFDTPESEVPGSIEIGMNDARKFRYLSPVEVFTALRHTEADITVVLNSCYSGCWVNRARPPSNMTILARCNDTGEVLSFPASFSEQYRGGFFPYYFSDRLYNEYGLFFPRPPILQVTGGSEHFVAASPATNLSRDSMYAQRQQFSEMRDIVSDLAKKLHTAGVLDAEPRLLDRSRGYGTALIGVGYLDDLPLRLWQLHPQSSSVTGRSIEGGVRNQAERAIGSVVQGHQPEDKLEQLIKLYLNLVQRPQNAASNVSLSCQIMKFRRIGKMMDNRERAELKAELERRVNRYLMAKDFAERVHAVWPLEFSKEVAEMGYWGATAYTNLKVFIVAEGPVWNIPWAMLRACLLQAAVPVQVVEDCRKQLRSRKGLLYWA
jgi:hypothetical protein